MPIFSASSLIKTVRILLRDYDADPDSDSGSDSHTQPRVKRYIHAIVNKPEPAALSSFTSFSERSGDGATAAAAPSQTLQLGLSVGRYPREDDVQRRACGYSASYLAISGSARLSSATSGAGMFTGYYSREHDGCPEIRYLALSEGRYPGDDDVILDCLSTAADILKDLGYLPKSDDSYSEIQSAIERFQLNHGLKDTRVLDFQTVTAITERRCSWPDIVDGVNLTRLHGDGPSCFTLFPGAPKWDKFALSYSFEGNVPAPAKAPFRLAFAEWARRTGFTFSEKFAGGDIKIGFYRGSHGVGDCRPFNGPGGILAHAFEPCDGRLHVDMNQKWSFLGGDVDMETTALHELGHVLGLSHSSDEDAVMYGGVKPGQVKRRLTNDDIRGINFLYCDH